MNGPWPAVGFRSVGIVAGRNDRLLAGWAWLDFRFWRPSSFPEETMRKVLGILFVTLAMTSGAWAQDKKRMAVLDFDYGTVRSAVQAYFGTDQDVGKGISLLLEQKLVQDAKYRVIDRNSMDKILKEQNFSNSDRVDATTAAKIGRILGVSAIITGSITQFGRDDKHIGLGGGGYGLGKYGLGGIGKNDADRKSTRLNSSHLG